MDAITVAAELLDDLPANRTLGVTVAQASDGIGVAELPVVPAVRNVIGALHASGIVALVDAAALAAVLSAAPSAEAARRLQPLGTRTEIAFAAPVRDVAHARCVLDDTATAALADLFAGRAERVRFDTATTIGDDRRPDAARGTFEWVVRLAG